MNTDGLHRKLIAVARADIPSDRVPYAFEKRITALIASRTADVRAFWARGLVRMASLCAAVALLAGAAAFFLQEEDSDFSQDFESTLLASVEQTDFQP